MIISVPATVVDHDGLAYRITGFVVRTAKPQLTHLLIADPDDLKTEYRVPIQNISDAGSQRIRLNCTQEAMSLKSERAADETYVRADARIKATDGYIGQLRQLDVTPRQGFITYLMVKEGLLRGRKSITLPDSLLGQFEEKVVHVKADKSSISHLPKVV